MRLLRGILGKALTGLFTVAAAVFLIGLWQLKMLPGTYFALLCIGLALLAGVLGVLIWSGHGLLRTSIGLPLAVVLLAALIVGNVYLWQTVNTLDNVTNSDTEIVHMGIYMRKDDTRSFDDTSAATYRYGILHDIDREATDGALTQLNEKLKTQVSYQEFLSFSGLVDALLDGEVDAIILNQAILPIFEELPGYSEKLEKIREVVLHEVEVPIETEPTTPTKNTDPSVTTRPDPTVTETPSASTTPGNTENTEMTENTVSTEGTANTQQPTTPPAQKIKPFVVCISGLDNQGTVSTRSCSDVNILAVVNPETKQVLLVSTPRDYFIPLSNSKGMPDKLTHAGLYGVNVTKDSLAMLYDVEIDYYFKVNFNGFKKVIDALGGITVYSEKSFTGRSHKVTYTFQQGLNELNGAEALAFCRIRDAFATGDRQRGKNQMAVIKAVIEKMMSRTLLTNYTSILNAVESSVVMSIPKELIGSLVSQQLSEGGSWNVVTYSVNGSDDWAVPYTMRYENFKTYVMRPNQNHVNYAKVLIQDVLNGKVVKP